MTDAVYVVLRNSYGSASRPKSVTTDLDEAIDDACELAGEDRSAFERVDPDAYHYLGIVESGARSWRVFAYETDGVCERALDVADSGPRAPTRDNQR